jgi:hypothetical protein
MFVSTLVGLTGTELALMIISGDKGE